ncbi:MAG TPA: TIGR01777 family oxidoreductase [Acidobacteriota bacterium]|nr:TIGR01777 family oxidoreductase [Acidobacteriota bacterium]HRR26212.1 TIGR01777 family oxidoreductase [Acidobacteriota bacterium]
MKVALTGATGLVGTHLLRHLREQGVLVRVVGRRPICECEFRFWDLLQSEADPTFWEGVDAVVHLAGEPIAGRPWTRGVRERITRSRVEGTRRLIDSIRHARTRPNLLINASAIGIYGDRGEELLDETSLSGNGFLAEVCRRWEEAARQAADLGLRVVRLRTGIVMATEGGFLPPQVSLFRWGLGAQLGDGRQYVSWIHIGDLVALISTILQDRRYEGPVNAVSPSPVTNAEFTRCLGRVLGKPAFLRIPRFLLLAAGTTAKEMLLSGQRVVPARALSLGFRFRFPELESTLRDLLANG